MGGPIVSIRWKNGINMKYRGDSVDRGVIKDIYERNCYGLPEDMTGKVVIDVGAHIGAFSILAGSRGARVFAYEPERENHELLVDNIRINNMPDRIIPFFNAVGNPGPRSLFLNPKSTDGHTLHDVFKKHGNMTEFQRVMVLDLKTIIKDAGGKCDFLKLDCEGAEVEILEDVFLGLYGDINNMIVEYHYKGTAEKWTEKLKPYYDTAELSQNERKHIKWLQQ